MYLWNAMQGFAQASCFPLTLTGGCTSKSQHSAVEICPLKARASCSPEAGLQDLGSWLGPEAQYPFLFWGWGGVSLANVFFTYGTGTREPSSFYGSSFWMPEKNLNSTQLNTKSWNLRDYWNGNSGPLLLRRCFIENALTYSPWRVCKRRQDAQQSCRLFSWAS